MKKLSNDELRAKTLEIKNYVQNSGEAQKEEIAKLKASIEETPIDEREAIFNQIDKLEKEVLEIYETALNEVMPVAFSIVKTLHVDLPRTKRPLSLRQNSIVS